jgi:two-component system cell cycle sensor histidine kinase/response regulator CckA
MPRKGRAPKSNERKFHELLETLPLIVYSVEPKPPYAPIYVSRGVEALGYTRDEWLEVPDRWIRSIHPDDRERVLAAAERAFNEREPLDDEYRLLTRDGSVRWIHDRGSFVLDKKGRVVEWHGVMVDVTPRKQAELQMVESEERYRRLIEASPDAIFVHAKGRILFANPAAAVFFGAASAEALAGVSVARLVHGHSRKEIGSHVKEILNKGKTDGPVELRWVTLDGRMVDSEVTGSTVTVNGRTAVQVTARDISARRDAHEELHKTLAMLEATIESTTDGILVVDTSGRMVRMNSKFVELWRIPPDVLASRNDAEGIAFVLDQLEDPEAFVVKIRDLYKNPDLESFDTLRFKDGRVYERTSKPQRLGDQTVGRVWSFRDVTRRLELEGQVRQAQKMDAIGSLAGGVAHDFNNILTVIRGNVELMLMDTDLPDVHRGDLGVVYGAAERAMELTRQLLAFSRKQVIHPVALDLGAVVAELEPMLRRLIGEDIVVATTLEPSTTIIADRAQIEQVLLNLAVNGRDAMPRGGTLTIHTAHVDVATDRRLRGATIPAGRYVALEVEDTGLGIAPHHIDRVFEPFFTTKEAGRGTGLGLATVYGIVKQSNGFVDVESWLGAGTAFRILLPAADQRPTSKTAEFPVVDVGSGRVLVVEDEFAVRQFVRRALEKRGYEILQAASGPDAIELVRSQSGTLDLIVTDVVMPGMSGARLIQELRNMGVDAPVLYMSGYTDDEVIRRGVKHSEVMLLAKPFTAPQLAAAVQKVMRAAKSDAVVV